MDTRMNTGKKWVLGLGLLGILAMFNACDDGIPNDYIPQYFTETYLLVGQPIQGVRLMRSMPPLDSIDIPGSMVKDASISVFRGDEEFRLEYREDTAGIGEYYYPDESVLIDAETEYRLEIRLSDGGLITGRTTTPARFEWVKRVRDTLQYPIDTLKLESPDSLSLEWTDVESITAFLIAVRCLDTLDYGGYLDPPREESNRRIYRPWEENAPRTLETTRWGLIPNTRTPVVWFAFKWFGPHSVRIYAPDDNMFRWYQQTHFGGSPAYDPLLSSVEGDGIGCFGSASIIENDVFLIKNQP